MARILNKIYGHDEVIAVLLAAVAQQRLASSFIFAGPAGIGKRQVALGLAQALVCEKTPAACGVCGPCLRIESGQSESLFLLEPMGANIKIEQSREALQFLNLRQMGRARVLIFDEAQTLGPQAGNALLKAIEEPPSGTHFIFVTSNAPALLTTIRSRSQLLRFQPLALETLRSVLKAHGAPAEEWALRSALGRVDQALQLSDKQAPWNQARLTALHCLGQGLGGQDMTENLKDLVKDKSTALFTLRTWLGLLRDWALVPTQGPERALNADQLELLQWGSCLSPAWIFFLSQKVLQLEQDVTGNIDRNLAFENFGYLLKRAAAQGSVPQDWE